MDIARSRLHAKLWRGRHGTLTASAPLGRLAPNDVGVSHLLDAMENVPKERPGQVALGKL
jgi:hypothetical protein